MKINYLSVTSSEVNPKTAEGAPFPQTSRQSALQMPPTRTEASLQMARGCLGDQYHYLFAFILKKTSHPLGLPVISGTHPKPISPEGLSAASLA
jgi:hypothetical protein